MTSVENVRFQLRNGTSTQWANANTVLLAGEPGFDTTNKILKIGDGTNLWSALQSFNTGSTGGSTGSVSSGSTANLVNITSTGTIYGGLDSGTSSNTSVNLGYQAGQIGQNNNCIAIGTSSGQTTQLAKSIAIGFQAGNSNQSFNSIAIGELAGSNAQSNNSIAIGTQAGQNSQGINCIAIGNLAASATPLISFPAGGFVPVIVQRKQEDNTIVLNATGVQLNGVSGQTGSLYIAPIRSDPTQTLPLCYNPSTFEIVRGSVGSGSGSQGIQGVTGAQGPTGNTIFNPVTQTVFIGNGSSGSTGCINIGVGVGGSSPGVSGQGNNSIAIGFDSGGNQGSNCVSIGTFASGGQNSVSLGFQAGYINQGSNCIALGYYSGRGVVNHQPNNTIILNATGLEVDGVSGQTGSFYVSPIRSDPTQTLPLCYNPTTNEIVRGPISNTIFNPVTQTVFIGNNGSSGSTGCVNIGTGVGISSPGVTGQGNNSIAIGEGSGSNQGSNCVSIGTFASGAGNDSISLGFAAGRTNQKGIAVAIGYEAGNRNQGQASIAIGYKAGHGTTNPQADNTIILNATLAEVSGVSGQTGSCYVAPIRSLSGASTANQGYSVLYNPVTKELYIA